MNTRHCSLSSLLARVSSRRHVPLICAASIALFAATHANAQTMVKADNLDNLDQTTSWVGGVVPGAANIALWDGTATAASSTLLGIDQSWKGIQISTPTGLVTIGAGNTLTLGSGGIAMAAATQDLTLDNNVTLLGATAQSWTVGAGRTLDVNGTYARGVGAMINFDTTAGGTINIASLGASTMIGGHSTINKTDFAALDGSQNVVEGAVAVPAAYTVNANTGAALPNMAGTTFSVVDVVNSNTNAISAFRLSNTLTVSTGIRFNTAHASAQDWVVDVNTRNLNVSNAGILVTAAVGAKNVIFNGGTGNLRLGANVDFYLHQHNTAGDLILNAQITQSAGVGSRLNKTGAGRLILQHNGHSYGGATIIHEGTLQIGNGGASGAISAASAVTNNGTLAFNRTDTVTFPNAISGAGQVTQAGSGTLILSGANTYTGATNFNAGTVEFTALANFGSGAALNFNGGTLRYAAANTADISTRTLTLNGGGGTINTNANNVTLANSIGNSGTGGLTKAGAGTLTLSGANNYSGGTTITTGTVLANNVSGSATGSGAVTVNLGGTLGGTGAIAGAVTVNSGGIVAPGASVESLDLGGITLTSGAILNFEFASLVSHDVINVTNAAGLVLNGGGLNLYAENTLNGWTTVGTYNLFSYSGGIGGTGTTALSVLNPQGGFTYAFGSTASFVTLTIGSAGVVSNWIFDGGDSWNTAGRWSAAVPNGVGQTARFNTALTAPATVTLDGGKTVGALVFNSAGNGYTVAQGSGGTLTIDNNLDPGSFQVLAGSHVVSAPVSLVSNTTADVAASSSLALSGGVSGSGALTKTSGGTLILTGTNSYASTTINGGAVEFDGLAALGAGGLTFGGGTLRWAAANTADVSLSTVTFSTGGGTFDTNGNNVLLTAAIGNNGAGGLTKTGAGVLTLSAASAYAGSTAVNGGKLSVSANDQLGDPATGAAVSFNGGTLATTTSFNLDNGGVNVRPLSFGASGGTLETATGTTLTVAGALSGGALAKTGDGTLVLNGSNLSYTGAVTLTGGTVILGGGDVNGQNAIGIGPITFNGGTLQMNGHNVVNTTPGYGNLGNAINVPTGQAGTLRMPSRGSLSSTITGDGTLNLVVAYVRGDWNANASTFTGTINVATANGVNDFRINNGNGFASARLHLGANVYMAQIFNPPSGAPFTTTQNIGQLSGDAGSFLSGNPVNGRFVNWSVGGLNTNSTFAGAITNAAGAARLTKVGTGNLTLTGTSTFTGGTFVSDGTLTAVSDGALGSTLGAGLTLNPAVNATVHFSGAAPFIGSLASGGVGTSSVVLGDAVAGTPTNLSVGGNATATTFAGVISDGTGSNAAAIGTLTKATNGTLMLTGANTYTGGSVASGGILQAANTLAFPSYATPGKVIGNAGGTVAVNVLGGGEWTLADVDTLRTSATFNAGSALGLDTTNSAGGFDYTTSFGGLLGITKLGTDSLTLSGVNTYTGATTVAQGILNAVNNQSLGSASAGGLVLSPATGTATVNFASLAPAIGSLASSGAGASTVFLGDTLGGSPTVLTLGANNSSSGYAGTISDGFFSNAAAVGSLVKVGAGTQMLSGTNDYTGSTTVNAGTLQALQTASLPGYSTAGKVTVNSTATLAVNAGGAIEWDASSIDTLRASVTFNAGSALGLDTTNAAGGFSYASNIGNGVGALAITKLGPNTLTLSGTNTYTGGTRINGGILALGSLGALGSTGPISFVGGTLQFSAANTTDYSARFSTAADQDFSVDTNGQTVTLASVVSSTGGSMTKLGDGILNLNGSQTYDTLTTSAGTTNVNSALGTGTSTVNANATTNFAVSQTLAALSIGGGAIVAMNDGALFATFGGSAASAVVPEPGALGMLMVGAVGLLARRRRNT